MTKNVIVFDLDDTLYKEIDFLTSAYTEISGWIEVKYGKKGVYDFMFASYMHSEDVFDALNRFFNLHIRKDCLLSMYRNHLPAINLSDGAEEFLRLLIEKKCILGIITDGRESTQMNKIKSLRLDSYIPLENCIISESIGAAKPSDKAYLFFQDKYGAANYFYIGDNERKDFISPNLLGWTTICLLDNGKNIHKKPGATSCAQKAQYDLQTWAEITGLFRKEYL